MAHDVAYKRPGEELDYEFDFTEELPDDAGVTLAATTVTAIDSSGASATATIVGTITESTTSLLVSVILQAGIDGETYLVTCHAQGVTSLLDREKTLDLRVRSKIVGNM